MKQRIDNHLHIACPNTEFTTYSNIEFYIKQDEKDFYRQYTLGDGVHIISDTELLIEVPQEDVMALIAGKPIKLQFAFTDDQGCARASEILKTTAGEFLKEIGYA